MILIIFVINSTSYNVQCRAYIIQSNMAVNDIINDFPTRVKLPSSDQSVYSIIDNVKLDKQWLRYSDCYYITVI